MELLGFVFLLATVIACSKEAKPRPMPTPAVVTIAASTLQITPTATLVEFSGRAHRIDFGLSRH